MLDSVGILSQITSLYN